MKTRTVVVLAAILVVTWACTPERCTVVIHDATHDTSWVDSRGDTLFKTSAAASSAVRGLPVTTVAFTVQPSKPQNQLKTRQEVARICAVYDTVHSPR
jgi:hypothetical protein